MIQNIEEFFGEAEKSLYSVNNFFEKQSLKDLVQADHLGYKCATHEEFEILRKIFEFNSLYIYQSIIVERRIAIIRLQKPLQTSCGDMYYLELSDQKPDNSFVRGFEHVEVYPQNGNIDELVKFLQEKNISIEKTEKPHHTTWDFFVEGFKVRIEAGPLIEKIKREEMI